MALPVILAEKPKQAQSYADALKPYTRKNGYIEVGPNDIFPEGAIITWAFGHLLELAKPEYYKEEWGKWDISTLPINPINFKYLVNSTSKIQYDIIRDLLQNNAVNEIIISTDTDREGESIAWSIIEKASVSHKSIKRLWINSLEEDVIREGFKNLRNGQDYYNKYIEAQTRQISDWLIGMNASQIFTLFLRENGVVNDGAFSVGRVQTVLLYMVFEREKAINDFVAKPFYELYGKVNHPNGSFSVRLEGRYDNCEEIHELLRNNGLSLNEKTLGEVTNVTKKLRKVSSPRLYTMSGIQMKANKEWKYSPSKVLELVQSLYEKKLLTYPRTDTPFITENEFFYLKDNLKAYQKVIGADFICAQSEPQNRYVDSKKVQEHYAIIPTKNVPTESVLLNLSQEELIIYHEVVKNTISMFHEPYQYNETVVEIQHKNLIFKGTGKVEVSKGWKELYPVENNDKDDAPPLPSIDKGDPIQIMSVTKEGSTTRPKRLTEGDLIPLMISGKGKQLEEEEQDILKETEGIGTEATRANIIETIKKQKYIEVKKNLVHITDKGVILCEAVSGSLLSSPSLTAKWETFLRLIGKGERKQETFLKGINTFIEQLLIDVPKRMKSDAFVASIGQHLTVEHIGKCPNCENGYIVLKNSFYGCTSYKDGCKQTFHKTLLKKNVTETQLRKLLERGKTDLIKGFKGKKSFDAYLTLVADKQNNVMKFNFQFDK